MNGDFAYKWQFIARAFQKNFVIDFGPLKTILQEFESNVLVNIFMDV